MAQVFSPKMNTIAKVSVLCGALLPLGLICVASAITRSPYNTKVDVPLQQPVPFSHEHHVNELGIDCRYCHVSVERSATASIPPTHTCMSCHSQIWTNSPLLEPIRQSYATNTPIKDSDGNVGWSQLNKVPEFVYFNHSIHIARGISCNICHGPVQTMQLAFRGKPFFMAWCLNCHRNPENFVRNADLYQSPMTTSGKAETYIADRNEVFNLYRKFQRGAPLTPEEEAIEDGHEYQRSPEELAQGRALLTRYHVKKAELTDCWICHR
jgi:hypothetical protein